MMELFFGTGFYRALWYVLLLSWLATAIPWCIVMQRALETIDRPLRKIEPGLVWLALVPGLNFVWHFLVVNTVADGLRSEFSRRSFIVREARPGFNAGMTTSVLYIFMLMPGAGVLLSIISCIPRLIHLAKIRSYTQELVRIREAQQAMPQQEFHPEQWMPQHQQQAEEQAMKTDPSRFMPRVETEEDVERWRKKD